MLVTTIFHLVCKDVILCVHELFYEDYLEITDVSTVIDHGACSIALSEKHEFYRIYIELYIIPG